MDERTFRDAMGKFATGITVVTIYDNKKPIGMTVNAFMSISLEPKLIAISIDESASMYDQLNQSSTFGVSMLKEKQTDYSQIFARQIKQTEEVPFTDLDGVPVLEDALVTLACRVHEKVKAGDHLIYIAEVTDLTIKEGEPTIFFGGNYRKLENQ